MKLRKRIALGMTAVLMAVCGLFAVSACKDKDPCADGHSYGEPQWTWTETTTGYEAKATFTCTVNGEHREEQAATVTAGSVTPSTCTVAGKASYTATVTFGDKTYTESKEKTLPLAEHSYSATYSKNDTNHWYECSVCHAKKDNEAHKPGAAATETTAQTCTECGYEIASALNHVHTYGSPEWTWTKTANGYTATLKVTCTKDSSHTKTLDAEVTNVLTPSTCKVAGSNVFTASVTLDSTPYSDTKTDTLLKLDHTPAAAVRENEVAATCSANGSYDEVVKCSVCEEEISRTSKTTEKIAHTPAAAVRENEVAATCSAKGSYDEVVKCSVCEAELSRKTKTTPKTDHTFTTETVAATCATRGSITRTCSVCEHVETEILNPLGHAWNHDGVTCTEGRTCTRTGCTASEPALGHNYIEKASAPATCTADGTTTFECSHCHDVYTAVTASATGHRISADAEWNFDPANDKHISGCEYSRTFTAECEECHEAVEDVQKIFKHNYTSSVSKLATCTEKGKRTFTCTGGCGGHYDEDIEINEAAHKWDAGTTTDNITEYKCAHNEAHTRTVISAKQKVETTLPATALENTNEIELQNASIALDDTVKEQLKGDFSIGADTVNKDDLPVEIPSDLQDKIDADTTIYNLTLKQGDDNVDFKGGKVTVRVPYTLEEGEDPEDIAICYINGDRTEFIKAVYADGFAVFEVEHFSYYTVTRLTPAERCEIYGHSYSNTVKAPTCVTEGYTLQVCQRCGKVQRVDYVPALGHDMHDEVREVTCTTAGTKVSTCTREGCGYTYTTVTPALGHDWKLTETVDATCTAAGHKDFTCTHDSSHTYRTTIAQKQHNYALEVHEPTCTEGGYTKFSCTGCDYSYNGAFLPATGHKFVSTVVAPTCTTDGYTLHECVNKDCDESYRSDEVKAAHVWNIQAPTCGEGQVCLVCEAAGLPATGEHNMVNGVCSVCGAGCSHEFETSTVAPTCTEAGYTLKTCKVCGVEQKSDYVAATGHSGKLVCTVCKQSLLPENFFKNLFTGIAESDFNIVISNAEISLTFKENSHDDSEEVGVNYKMDFGELFISYDEDEGLTAYANGSITMTGYDFPTPVTMSAAAVLADGTVFIKVDYFGESVHYGNGKIAFSNEDHAMYLLVPVESAGVIFGGGSTAEGVDGIFAALPEIMEMLQTHVVPLVKNILAGSSADITGFVTALAEQFINIDKTSTGYTLSLDKEGFKKFADNLKKLTVSENYDLIFGEGAFNGLVEKITALTDSTLGELIEKLEGYGLDLDAVIDDLDALAVKITGSSQATISAMLGIDGDLRDMLKDEQFVSVKVIDLINAAMAGMGGNNKPNAPVEPSKPTVPTPVMHTAAEEDGLTTEAVKQMLTQFGKSKLIEFICGAAEMPVETVTEVTDFVLGIIENDINITVSTDGTGKALSTEIEFSVEGGDLFDGFVRGTVKLTPESTSSYDYDEVINAVERSLSGVEFKEDNIDWGKADVTVEKFEDGSLKKVTASSEEQTEVDPMELMKILDPNELQEFSREVEKLAQGREYKIGYSAVKKSVVEIEFFANMVTMFEADCGDWAKLSVICDYKDATFVSVVVTATLEDETVIASHEFKGYNSSSSHGNLAEFYYNKLTGKIEFLQRTDGFEDQTKHVYIEETDKHVPAVGCTGYGRRFYTCLHCGKSYVLYYTNGHGDTKYEFKFDDENNRNCEAGVTVYEVCKVCDEVVYQYHTEYHNEYGEVIDLSEYGVCEFHDIRLVSCGCGMSSHLQYNGLVEGYENSDDKIGDKGDYNSKHYLYCEHCGLRIDQESTGTLEDCIYTSVTDYTLSMNDEVIKTYRATNSHYWHNMLEYVYLSEGSASCLDGCYVVRKCADCGYEEQEKEEYHRHVTGITESGLIDLKKYGAQGGTILVPSCACGEVVGERLEVTGLYERNEGPGENGAYWEEYTFKADGFRVRIEYSSARNPQTCTSTRQIKIIADGQEVKSYFSEEESHRYSITNVQLNGGNSCYDGVLVTETCADCGSVRTYEDHGHVEYAKVDIDLSQYGAVCGEHMVIRGCACGEGDKGRQPEIVLPDGRYGDFEDTCLYWNTEYDYAYLYRCAVTDPVPCGLTYCLKVRNNGAEAEYVILLGCDENGENAKREYVYRTEEMHNYVEEAEQINGCHYKVTRYCTIHPDREEERSVRNEERHTFRDYVKAATCSQAGYVIHKCVFCGYTTRSEVLKPEHNFVHDNVNDIHYCTVCGLENQNGVNGNVTLEECTALNPDADTIVVGYYLRDRENQDYTESYILNITLILGENLEPVLVQGVAVTRWREDLGTYVCFSKSAVDSWATENDYADYDIRLSFVPVGGGGDLDYGITFGSLVEANSRKLQIAKTNATETAETLLTKYGKFGYENAALGIPNFESAESIEQVNNMLASFKSEIFQKFNANRTKLIDCIKQQWNDLLKYEDASSVSVEQYEGILAAFADAVNLNRVEELLHDFNELVLDVQAGEPSPEKQFAKLKDTLISKMQNDWTNASNWAFIEQAQADEYESLLDRAQNATNSQQLEVIEQQFFELMNQLRSCEHENFEFVSASDTGHNRVCTKCKYVLDAEMPHKFGETIDGAKTCADCGYVHTHTPRMNGDDIAYVTINLDNPDQTSDQIYIYKHAKECTACSEEYDAEYHTGEWGYDLNNGGDKRHQMQCTVCSMFYGEQLMHSFFEEEHRGEQTCTVCGYTCEHRNMGDMCVCPDCGYSTHTPDESGELLNNDNGHYYRCSKCGGDCEPVAHTWTSSDGSVKCSVCDWICNHNQATAVDGAKHKCNYCETEIIHQYDSNGYCFVCNYRCEHEGMTGCICEICKYTHHTEDVAGGYKNDENEHWYMCSVCNEQCTHNAHIYNVEGKCTACEYVHPEYSACAEHKWNFDSFGTEHYCSICGLRVAHSYENGVCTVCGYQCTHSFSEGVCAYCGTACKHEWNMNEENHSCGICYLDRRHEWENGVCTVCNYNCKHNVYDPVNDMCDRCHLVCEHNWNCTETWHSCEAGVCNISGEHQWEDGVCRVCGYECKHNGNGEMNDSGHACIYCHKVFDHTWNENNTCIVCNHACQHTSLDESGHCTFCNYAVENKNGDEDKPENGTTGTV